MHPSPPHDPGNGGRDGAPQSSGRVPITSITDALLGTQARRVAVAAACGLLASLAFPPVGAWWLSWVVLAPLLAALARCTGMRQAVVPAYAFGVATWAVCVPWIGVSVASFLQSPIGWVAWVLLCGIQGLWYAAWGALAWRICQRPGLRAALALAASWTLMEWARTLGALAMPWCLLSHTQYEVLPVIQAASLMGAGLISFCIVLSNASIWLAARPGNGARLVQALRAAVPVGAVGCLLTYGWVSLADGDGRHADALPPIRITAMQPNVNTNPLGVEGHIARREAVVVLPTRAAPDRPFVVAWPESSAEDVAGDLTEKSLFAEAARLTRAWQIIGSGGATPDGRPTNSAFVMSPRGEIVARYDKRHLVPFGEWTPARWLFVPLERWFRFVEDDVAGTSDGVLLIDGLRIGALICFESVIPALARRSTARGATLLLNLTNDSWAGRSSALEQHLAITVFRSVEMRRPMVVAGLTGPTASISPYGRIERLPPYELGLLTTSVTPRTDRTPYLLWGNAPLLTLCIALLAMGLLPAWGRPRR